MDTQLIGRLTAFKGDDDLADRAVMVEVTDTSPGGVVEIACDVNLKGVDRIYLALPLQDLVRCALKLREPTA